MNRQQFKHAQRMARTFVRYGREVGSMNSELASHMLRWFQAEYWPLNQQVDLFRLWCRPGAAVFHTEMLKVCPEQRAARLSMARMARYFRRPAPLPR